MPTYEIQLIATVEVNDINDAYEIAREAESGFCGRASSTVTELKE